MNKMKTVVLGKRGQLVIPLELRRDLGLKDGEALVLFEKNGQLLVRKEKDVLRAIGGDDVMFDAMLASVKTLNKIWEDEPEGLWESYL